MHDSWTIAAGCSDGRPPMFDYILWFLDPCLSGYWIAYMFACTIYWFYRVLKFSFTWIKWEVPWASTYIYLTSSEKYTSLKFVRISHYSEDFISASNEFKPCWQSLFAPEDIEIKKIVLATKDIERKELICVPESLCRVLI